MKKLIARTALMLFLLLVTAYALFPFLWMLITSVKTEPELRTVPPTFFPGAFTLSHYGDVFLRTSIPRYFLNSLVVAIGATLISLALAVVSAYGLSRFRFRGRSLLLTAVLSSQMIPTAAMIVPLFLMLRSLGVINTYAGLILAYLVFTIPLSVWMMTNYFNSIPYSVEEAAIIDGATRLQCLVYIVLPVSIPSIVATGIYNFISAWNEFIFALSFASEKKVMTLPIGLAEFISEFTIDWGGLMAGSVLMTVPVVTIFFLLQRYFISGLTAGATKG